MTAWEVTVQKLCLVWKRVFNIRSIYDLFMNVLYVIYWGIFQKCDYTFSSCCIVSVPNSSDYACERFSNTLSSNCIFSIHIIHNHYTQPFATLFCGGWGNISHINHSNPMVNCQTPTQHQLNLTQVEDRHNYQPTPPHPKQTTQAIYLRD